MALAELEASNTRPPRKLIHSHQSEILAELDWLLSDSDRPLRLRKNIDRLKLLLMDAWVIRLELNAGTLKLMAHKGEAFTNPPVRGLSPLYLIVLDVLNRHGKSTSAEDVWQHLKNYEGGGVIDEISGDKFDGEIFLTGKKKPTTFKAFQTQLSEVRKKVTE